MNLLRVLSRSTCFAFKAWFPNSSFLALELSYPPWTFLDLGICLPFLSRPSKLFSTLLNLSMVILSWTSGLELLYKLILVLSSYLKSKFYIGKWIKLLLLYMKEFKFGFKMKLWGLTFSFTFRAPLNMSLHSSISSFAFSLPLLWALHMVK